MGKVVYSSKLFVRTFFLFVMMGFGVKGWGQVIWAGAASCASGTSGTWLTTSNWCGGSLPTSTSIAQFGANGSNGTIGMNMNGVSISAKTIGAIELSSSATAAKIINNSSTTVGGAIILMGTTISSIANVIVRNNSSYTLTIQDGGSSPFGISLGNTTENKIIIDGNGGVNISSVIKDSTGGAKNLVLAGSGQGTLTLSGANTYTGYTKLNSLSSTLILGGSGVISDVSNIIFAGGTFKTGASTGYNETVGTLSLIDNTTIALGSGSHNLKFANSSALAWTSSKYLTITGWTGTACAGATGTAGKVFFGNSSTGLTESQLSQIKFTISGVDYPAMILSTGEIVPTLNYTVSAPTPGTPGSGAAFSVTVSSTDFGGNARNVPTTTSAFTLSTNGNAGSIGGTTTGSITNGTSSTTVSGVTLSGSGSGVTITATRTSGDNLKTGTSSTFSVSGGVAPTLTAAVGATVDNSFDITFTSDATWTAAITSVKYGSSTLTLNTDYTISNNKITLIPSGSSGSGLRVSGTQTVTVIATGYSDGLVSQTIGAGAATKLAMKTQPTAPASNGSTLATQPEVYIQDQYGNTTLSTATVSATVGSGTWTLGGTSSVSGINGTATYTGLTATATTSLTGVTIDFSSTGLTGVTSSSFNIPSPPPPTLNAANSATVDASFDITFTDNSTWRTNITGISIGGNSLTNSAYSISSGVITLSPAQSTLLQSSGVKTISVSSSGFADATLSQTISAGVATKLAIVTQPTAPLTNGAVLAAQPVISIQDQYSNVTNSTATVSASPVDGTSSWSLGGTTSVAGLNGTATFTGLTATSTGANTGVSIVFSSSGLTGITSSTFNIPAPPADHLSFTSVPSIGTSTVYLASFTVSALRPDNTVDASYSGQVTLSLNISSGSGTLSGSVTKNLVSGVATFNDISISSYGVYSLTASLNPLTATTSSSISIWSPLVKWSMEGITTTSTATTPTFSSGSAQADIGSLKAGSLMQPYHVSSATAWATGSAGNASAQGISSDHWAIGDYWQFAFSTSGYKDIKVVFDQTGSNTGPKDYDISYSLDGTTFSQFATYVVTNDSWGTTGSRKLASEKPFDLSSITSINNVSLVYIRLSVTSNVSVNSSTVAVGGTSRLDNFTITGTSLSLPVSFSSINATKIGKNNLVAWSTASEEHNKGFDVQRSTDGVNYTSLGFVNSLSSTGNSSSTLNYSFIDYNPIGLKQYYRLKQTDFDGTSRYSGVVVVTNAVPERLAVTSIYPNPVSSFVHLSVASPSREAMQLIVTDANGRTVRNKYVNAEVGNNSFEVDVTGLGAGIYYLSLKGPLTGWQSVGKFVKN